METWRAVVGYETFYEVSSEGSVRSLVQGIGRHHAPHFLKLAPFRKLPRSYLAVRLQPPGQKRVYRSVHRLVAQAFHANPLALPTVNHLNGVRGDNRAVNLEWASYRDNNLHALRTGLRKPTVIRGEQYSSAKMTDETVRLARSLYRPKTTGAGYKVLARQFGIGNTTMRNILNGKSWSHVV